VKPSNLAEGHERLLRRDTESRADPAQSHASSTGHIHCANKQGIEGIVGKRAEAGYPGGRRDWVKVRHADTTDAAVVGYTGPRKRPRNLALVPEGESTPRLSARIDPALAVRIGAALGELSFREAEELMLQRGVIVSYKTVRRWCAKFGQAYADGLRRRRPRPGDKWHLDEVFIKVNGERKYLWRAVDQDGNVLDILVQSRRDKAAARRLFHRQAVGVHLGGVVGVDDGVDAEEAAEGGVVFAGAEVGEAGGVVGAADVSAVAEGC
jgi:hypothetical protein